MWDVIVLIPDHCLSIYFLYTLLLLGENGTSKETGSQGVDKYRREMFFELNRHYH